MAKPNRPNAATIQASDATAHAFTLLRVAGGQRAEAFSVLKELEIELVAEVERAGDLPNVRTAKLKELLKSSQAIIASAYAVLGKQQVSALEDIAVIEGRYVAKQLNKTIGVDLLSSAVDPGLLRQIVKQPVIMGHSAASWWAGQDVALQRAFAAQMQMGALRGETVAELTRRVRGTKANGFKDGIMEFKAKRDAEALVLSSIQSVSNSARLASYEAQTDLIKAVEWHATLDGRTSLICKALDGLQWSLPGYRPIGHNKAFPGPTAHFRCRSAQLAITKSWDELAGKKLPSINNQKLQAAVERKLKDLGKTPTQIEAALVNARASMDGQVSDKTSMGEWIDGKDAAFQDATLGIGRAKLFRAGQITMQDLTDQNNRPLTIDQLRAAVETGQPPPETLGQLFQASAKATTLAEAKASAQRAVAAATEAEGRATDAEARAAVLEAAAGQPVPVESATAATAAMKALGKERDAITAELAKANRARLDAETRETFLYRNYQTGRLNQADYDTAINMHAPALTKARAAVVAAEAKHAAVTERARAAISVPEAERGAVTFKKTAATTPEAQAIASEGAAIVGRYTDKSLLPTVSAADVRSHAAFKKDPEALREWNDSKNRVWLMPGQTTPGVAAHEIVHSIERQDAATYEAANQFLTRRAKGKPSRALNEITASEDFTADEIAFEDEWAKRGGRAYTGRDYGAGSGGTEILTTGIERIDADPIEFATNDRDHFEFMLRTLRRWQR